MADILERPCACHLCAERTKHPDDMNIGELLGELARLQDLQEFSMAERGDLVMRIGEQDITLRDKQLELDYAHKLIDEMKIEIRKMQGFKLVEFPKVKREPAGRVQ